MHLCFTCLDELLSFDDRCCFFDGFLFFRGREYYILLGHKIQSSLALNEYLWLFGQAYDICFKCFDILRICSGPSSTAEISGNKFLGWWIEARFFKFLGTPILKCVEVSDSNPPKCCLLLIPVTIIPVAVRSAGAKCWCFHLFLGTLISCGFRRATTFYAWRFWCWYEHVRSSLTHRDNTKNQEGIRVCWFDRHMSSFRLWGYFHLRVFSLSPFWFNQCQAKVCLAVIKAVIVSTMRGAPQGRTHHGITDELLGQCLEPWVVMMFLLMPMVVLWTMFMIATWSWPWSWSDHRRHHP